MKIGETLLRPHSDHTTEYASKYTENNLGDYFRRDINNDRPLSVNPKLLKITRVFLNSLNINPTYLTTYLLQR